MLICTAQQPDGTTCGAENPAASPTQLCQKCGASLRRALEIHDPGTVIGHYRIVQVIGFGGFGAVYEAEHIQNRGRVALKEAFDPNNIRGFRSEFDVLQYLSHTNLPRYYEIFETQGNGYLVMEFVRGQSLEDVLNSQRGPLPESLVLGYAIQMCDALSYLHSQEPVILHRDIKPANIRLTPEGLIKLVDFGLLKQGTQTTRMTIRGAGTLQYAPVEQYGGIEHTDIRSDIYSLGATLYHLLTGIPPLPANVRLAQSDLLPPPRSLVPSLSPHVSSAISTAMNLVQQERYPDAATFKQALMGSSPLSSHLTVQVSPPQQHTVPYTQATIRVSPSPQPSAHQRTMVVPSQLTTHPTTASTARRGWWDSTWWVQWIVATAIGWAVGTGGTEWLLAEAIRWPVFMEIYDVLYNASGTVAYHALSGLIVGVVVGTAQGILLYRRIPGAFWWIVASSVGWGGGWAIGGMVAVPSFYRVIIGAAGGVFAGIAQWQVLQRHLPGTGWWVLVSALGWAAGRAVDDFLFGLVNGAIAGAISGVVLLWLLRRAPPRS
jgi:serine/threonine-protein kinase